MNFISVKKKRKGIKEAIRKKKKKSHIFIIQRYMEYLVSISARFSSVVRQSADKR